MCKCIFLSNWLIWQYINKKCVFNFLQILHIQTVYCVLQYDIRTSKNIQKGTVVLSLELAAMINHLTNLTKNMI